MLANDSYSKLLLYLENENKISATSKIKQKKKPEVKKKDLKDETKKLLEESTDLFSDVSYKINNSSKGFDVIRFESLMRSKLIDNYKKLESYERPYISVSELYSCLRKTYYIRSRFPIDIKKQFQFSYLYMIQKIGNNVHDIVQELYDFTEVEKTIISQKYKVKGRIDSIKENFLYELKTIDPPKFKGKYIDEHYYQGLIYAYILNSEYNYNIDTITIVYIPRDLKRIIPFDLPVNNSLAKSFLNRAPILLSSLSKKIPPDPIGSNAEQCKWCLYKEYCKKDETNMELPFLKKANKTNKPKKEKPKYSSEKDSTFLL